MRNTTQSINFSPATFHKPRATRYVPFATRYVPRAASRLSFFILVTLLVLSATSFVKAQQPVRLALLPFENISGSVDSLPIIMPLVAQSLQEKGYDVVPRAKIEPFLARNRIRNTSLLSHGQLGSLRKEFGVDFALLGSVDLFYESADNPQWGLTSRIVSTTEGQIVWADSAGRSGGDFTRMFGLGTITSSGDLARAVTRLLFQTLPASGTPFPTPQVRSNPTGGPLRTRIGYRSPVLDSPQRWQVAIATFENRTERYGAGLIATDVATTALFHHGRFQVMDPGNLGAALIALRRTPYGGLDFATLTELKKRTGLDGIFLGTVYRYNEGLKQGATASPEVSLDLRMLNTETGKILWFASGERTGDDSQVVFDFGIIRSMVPLLRRVIEEMLATL